MKALKIAIIFAWLVAGILAGEYQELNSVDNRQAIVHLFEWLWTDIADECERFLGPMGYAGVQVSPPMEHLIVNSPMRPWWERYQPVSYKLDSRSGTEEQFADMVTRCNKAGVRIYVDAVVNHMVGEDRGNGTGTGGDYYNADTESFPGVPYTSDNFNGPWDCNSGNQIISNWDDPVQVRNCRLVGLLDLASTLTPVREKIAAYFNKLVGYGVAGLRVDAAKHMWPADLKNIMDRTNDLPTNYFPAGSRLMTFQEVIDWGNSPIRNDEYIDSGRLCLFAYGMELSQAVRGGGGRSLSQFNIPSSNWGRPWLDDKQTLVFVDNHDTQRNGANVLTYKNGDMYKLAVGFMLALPYGAARVMSGYAFTNNDAGPPHNPDYSTAHVIINSDGTCGGGWNCEHRYPEIAHMAQFRWFTAGQPIAHWTTSGGNKVAFGRGNKGWYAVNKDGGHWSQTFQTGLPSGTYCDVISGFKINNACTGKAVTVGNDGSATVDVCSTNGKIPVIAIHSYSKINGPPMPTLPPTIPTRPGSSTRQASTAQPTSAPPATTTTRQASTRVPATATTSPVRPTVTQTVSTTLAPITSHPQPTTTGSSSMRQTAVLIYKPTRVGQNVFIRGGLDSTNNRGCTAQFSTDQCKIPIHHDLKVPSDFTTYLDWSKGDNYLNWQGAEPGQGTHAGQVASGTPLAWSTNRPGVHGYQPLNTYGQGYWIVEMLMDCSRTAGGWFEFKGFMNGWENNINQGLCTGNGSAVPPFSSINHIGRCGYINVYRWGSGSCEIGSFTA